MFDCQELHVSGDHEWQRRETFRKNLLTKENSENWLGGSSGITTRGDVRDSFPYFSVIGIEIMSCKTALGKEKLVCSGKILKDTLHLIILKMLQKGNGKK